MKETHHHVDAVKTYVGVFIALIVLTFTTVYVSEIDLGELHVVVALLIALIKASLVAWIFMGVRHSTQLTKLFVVAGLVWLCIMILITFSDYNSRTWTYQPQPWSTTKAGGASR
jgi:cytochrome c oxidase subunit 4